MDSMNDQAASASEVMNSEDEATLNELVEEAKSQLSEGTMKEALSLVAENENEAAEKADLEANGLNAITTVTGAITNLTNGTLNLYDKHKWHGHYVKNPPKVLNKLGHFVQSAIATKGCEAAVVYVGTNRAGTDECGWLLAWCNSKSMGRKVYVECGLKKKFHNVDWELIRHKLEKSTSTSTYTDATTGTKVISTIIGTSGQAAVAAAFS